MIKAYKIRLNPNNKQGTQLEPSAHVARWAYNWALNQKKSHYEETKKSYSQGDLRKHLTKLKKTDEYKWLYNFSNNITEIVKTKPSHIVIEDLNVKGMMKNQHLAKHIQ